MKDDPFTICRKDVCRMKTWGKGKVKRLLGTGAGLIFKGSGFYITDYRSEGYKQSAKKDSDAGKADSSPKPAADSAKPAAKTEKSTKPKKE